MVLENNSSIPKQQPDVINTSLVNLPHTPHCHSSPAKVKSKKSPRSKSNMEEHTSNMSISTLPHDTSSPLTDCGHKSVLITSTEQEKTEVWFHESCIVYVFLTTAY